MPEQLTKTIQLKQAGKNEQVLDKLKVERERGITGTVSIHPGLVCQVNSVSSQGTNRQVPLDSVSLIPLFLIFLPA
jgi:hypothetical protein